LNITTPLLESRHSKEMTRIIVFAVIVYGAYLLIRYFLRSMSSKNNSPEPPVEDKSRRKIDLNNVQDAEFEEIKKD
jgi:hypothetical protein